MHRISKQQPHIFQERIDLIDGFRGLASMLVIAYHYLPLFSFGWIGVDLFFVLSGLLITGSLVESLGSNNYFFSFYLKRILRIVPLYFAVLLSFFVVLPILLPALVSTSFAGMLDGQAWYWLFGINIYDAFNGWPANILFVPYWSLGCEMQFYFLWPFVVAIVYKLNKKWFPFVLVLLMALAMLFRIFGNYSGSFTSAFTYVLLPARIDAFAMGALLYFLFSEKMLEVLLRKGWIFSLTALFVACAIILYEGNAWHFDTPIISRYGFTLNAFFWGGLIAYTQTGGNRFLSKIFSSSWMRSAGKYSYGMYILHVPVKVILLKYIPINSTSSAMYYAAMLFALVITIVLSYASYHLLEKRFLRLKKYV
jgi:peptidoglycan/LPS O-acetylase OafA/YrhL